MIDLAVLGSDDWPSVEVMKAFCSSFIFPQFEMSSDARNGCIESFRHCFNDSFRSGSSPCAGGGERADIVKARTRLTQHASMQIRRNVNGLVTMATTALGICAYVTTMPQPL